MKFILAVVLALAAPSAGANEVITLVPGGEPMKCGPARACTNVPNNGGAHVIVLLYERRTQKTGELTAQIAINGVPYFGAVRDEELDYFDGPVVDEHGQPAGYLRLYFHAERRNVVRGATTPKPQYAVATTWYLDRGSFEPQ